MTRRVTILTNERDFAADTVVVELDRLGVEVVRVNVEQAVLSPVPAWSPGSTSGAPEALWWRQFELDASCADVADVDEVLVDRAQWRTWLSTFDEPHVRWVNPLWAARRAESKVEQLRVAQAIGFDVPATVVTNDRAVAERFEAEIGPVVIKTLSTAYFAFSDRSFVFTESFDHPAVDDPGRWWAAPVIVQQRIDAADARVICFGDETFGARCGGAGLDWRKTPYDPDLWQRYTVPTSVEQRCHQYRRELGLEYVAFDFMAADDAFWFLEANQAGEFSFLDRACDLGVAAAFARHLYGLCDD